MKPSYEERFSAATKKEMLRGKLRYEQEGKKKSSGRHAKILGGRPKKTPHYCSPWDEKGTILLLFKFCIHLHTYQDMQLKWCRVMGQKLRYGRPCTHDLPSTHNSLTQPHIASFLQNSTKYLMLTLSWKFGVNRCSFGLTHPAACTECVCL